MNEVPNLWITSIEHNYQHELIYAPSPTELGKMQAVNGGRVLLPNVTLTMEMDLTPGADAILREIHRNNGRFPFMFRRQEWRCLYCGTPNLIERALCSQCGAPRGWIL